MALGSDRSAADERELMLAGVRRFNQLEFFEAHDEWEKLWLERGPGGRTFVQALIQIAAAYHNVRRGKPQGARNLLDKALRRLAEFPDGWAGIDRTAVVAAATHHLETLVAGRELVVSDFPRLVVPDENAVTVGDR